MYRGILVCLLATLLAGGAMAGTWGTAQDSSELGAVETSLNAERVQLLLPPGTDLTGVRGSLTVEKFPVTQRRCPDGSMVRTLPVVFTFVNHWNETFMFDGYNEAVLTDLIGNSHFASAVVRNNRLLEVGVSGLVGPGHTVEFTSFYDLDPAYDAANLEEMRLDLRYLNHGHPYQLSAIVSSYTGMQMASGMWNVSSEPGVEVRPPREAVAQPKPAPPVQPEPPERIVQPAPEPVMPTPVLPPPKKEVPKPEPKVVEQPPVVQPKPVLPPPAPVVQQPAPAPVVAPPMPVAPPPAPVAQAQPAPRPLPVQPGAPCNPCFKPCCICIPLPNVGGFVCCVFDKVGQMVCCTANGACGLLQGTLCLADNLVCSSLKLVCCIAGQAVKGTCGMLSSICSCIPRNPCPPASCNPCNLLSCCKVCVPMPDVCGMANQVACAALSPLNCLPGCGSGGCGVLCGGVAQ